MRFKDQVWVTLLAVLLMPLASAGQKVEQQSVDGLYGLYYGTWGGQEADVALVISSDGQPIPRKENDSSAPTHPGFYLGERQFEFATSRFSPEAFFFRTKTVNGTLFSFHGRFAREQIDVIPDVPYLEGELKEMRNGRVVRRKKVHFSHAVVL
jgi:hypothetical protein